MIDPPRWTDEQLEEELNKATELFRKERMEEPLEAYTELFDQYRTHFEELLERTVDLSELESNALAILTDPNLRGPLRYLAGPPISEDDLKTVAEATLSSTRLGKDAEMVTRVIEVIRLGLDSRRFSWARERREPTEAERMAAVVASAALMAATGVGTQRRMHGSSEQEQSVRSMLLTIGFEEITPAVDMNVIGDTPPPGRFCGEAKLSGRKADFTVGLFDRRVTPVECKVSNSALNSIKRLQNDAAVKAAGWRHDLGDVNVVPVAVLSGVYKLTHLRSAQERGLTLFWAHRLDQMAEFIQGTRPSAKPRKRS